MFTYVVMRRCVSGIIQYHYYNASKYTKIGYAIPSSLSNGSVMIRHRRTKFRYINDPDITVVSGCSQVVYVQDTDEEFARVFWDGNGKHRIQTSDGTFDVTYENGVYAFSWNGFRFAALSAYKEGTAFSHPWGAMRHPDEECCMVMLANTEPPLGLALMMLSFPLLQIRP